MKAVKEALYVSKAPSIVVCRKDEQRRVFEFVKGWMEQKKAGSLYICGCPGTGKSLSMEKVRQQAEDWANQASLVETSKRPLPKLRNTNLESTRYEQKSVPQGTLNVAQVRHSMHLYQGKAHDHSGPMSVNEIAAKYRIDVSQVQKITQFLSLPLEVTNKQKKQNE